ncbi:hypothetical protein L218DRAFT_947359 [Marasmius fiardii PR-910]|nr:hypothetical protein L218DRAFT_947359 [Marasmius fiardii PR-910]
MFHCVSLEFEIALARSQEVTSLRLGGARPRETDFLLGMTLDANSQSGTKVKKDEKLRRELIYASQTEMLPLGNWSETLAYRPSGQVFVESQTENVGGILIMGRLQTIPAFLCEVTFFQITAPTGSDLNTVLGQDRHVWKNPSTRYKVLDQELDVAVHSITGFGSMRKAISEKPFTRRIFST